MDGRIRVLLVDDEEQFVLNLARLFEARGFLVVTAFDGLGALEAVRKADGFDVVVLDVKMPGMDGIETLRELKKTAPSSAVIMLTGHASIASGTQAIREGAYDFLMKPCDIEDLAEKIREACDVEGIRRRPVLWLRTRVEEIMLFSFKNLEPGDSLSRALEVFCREAGEMAAETLFVLDAQDRLQGLVTRRDLIAAAQEAHPGAADTWSGLCAHPELLPDRELAGVMKPAAITAPPGESLAEAAERMIEHRVRRMPIVKDGTMIGIIRLEEVLEHVKLETD